MGSPQLLGPAGSQKKDSPGPCLGVPHPHVRGPPGSPPTGEEWPHSTHPALGPPARHAAAECPNNCQVLLQLFSLAEELLQVASSMVLTNTLPN